MNRYILEGGYLRGVMEVAPASYPYSRLYRSPFRGALNDGEGSELFVIYDSEKEMNEETINYNEVEIYLQRKWSGQFMIDGTTQYIYRINYETKIN